MEPEIKKLINSERIHRILHRVCDARMLGLMRIKDMDGAAIRFTFSKIDVTSTRPRIFLTGLSDRGKSSINGLGQSVEVEIIGMSSKVLFRSKIISKSEDTLTISMPVALVSIDRRQATRYNTTERLCAFIKSSLWEPRVADGIGRPIVYPFTDVARWCEVGDVSSGGLSIVSCYPTIFQKLESGTVDRNAFLILPLHRPIPLSYEIRWVKKIKQSLNDESDRSVYEFRAGLQFEDLDEKSQALVKTYIRQLSLAEAI